MWSYTYMKPISYIVIANMVGTEYTIAYIYIYTCQKIKLQS